MAIDNYKQAVELIDYIRSTLEKYKEKDSNWIRGIDPYSTSYIISALNEAYDYLDNYIPPVSLSEEVKTKVNYRLVNENENEFTEPGNYKATVDNLVFTINEEGDIISVNMYLKGTSDDEETD